MKITNKHGMPEPFYEATCKLVGPRPEGKAIRTTHLIGPPRVRSLTAAHWDAIEDDCSDRVWALFGQLGHAVLEGAAKPGALTEVPLKTLVGDWTITGTADYYSDGKITDYKTASVFALRGGKPKPEWECQLNVYAFLFRRSQGLPVRELEILAIFRDWSERAYRDAGNGTFYPAAPIMSIPIPVWSEEGCQEYIAKRLAAHERNDPCNDEERWKSQDCWAVRRRGSGRALKVLFSEEEAEKYAEERTGDLEVEHRPGKYRRCESYCHVAPFCPQHRRRDPGNNHETKDLMSSL